MQNASAENGAKLILMVAVIAAAAHHDAAHKEQLMNNIEELKRFIYSATVTSGSGSQSFYIDAKSREEADARAANNESNGMYADDSEITDLDALEYEDETTVDDFGDFPLISREQSLIAQLEAAQKENHDLKMKLSDAGCLLVEWKQRVEQSERRANTFDAIEAAGFTVEGE